jgi:hypothetical protein
MPITTSMADSFKVEILQGAHCFNATVNPTATVTSGAVVASAVNPMTGVGVGMTLSGTPFVAGTNISAITSASTFNFSPAATASITTTAITITGDVFKMALVKSSPAGTYTNINSTNYSVLTGSTDEVSGVGYTVAGTTLVNYTAVSAVGPPIQAVVTFSNASWTVATFSTIGCMIYNTTDRMAGVTGRCCGVFDFGGTQTVSAGTFTVVMPGASSGSAILRVA